MRAKIRIISDNRTKICLFSAWQHHKHPRLFVTLQEKQDNQGAILHILRLTQ